MLGERKERKERKERGEPFFLFREKERSKEKSLGGQGDYFGCLHRVEGMGAELEDGEKGAEEREIRKAASTTLGKRTSLR